LRLQAAQVSADATTASGHIHPALVQVPHNARKSSMKSIFDRLVSKPAPASSAGTAGTAAGTTGSNNKDQQTNNRDVEPAWSAFIQKMGSVPSSVIEKSIEKSATTGVLVLTNRGLNEMPASAFNHATSLRILDLSANHMFKLPSADLAAFANLKSLFLNQNRLIKLPESIGSLEKLECLSVSYNFLESLPDSLVSLKHLREVKLAANKFSRFPEQLAGLVSLELLDLSANHIQSLQTQNISLANLMAVDMNLNENCLSILPHDLSKAPRLKVLRLQSNQLTLNSIPESLLAASQVCHFLLDGNKFEVDALKTLDGFESYVERYVVARNASIQY